MNCKIWREVVAIIHLGKKMAGTQSHGGGWFKWFSGLGDFEVQNVHFQGVYLTKRPSQKGKDPSSNHPILPRAMLVSRKVIIYPGMTYTLYGSSPSLFKGCIYPSLFFASLKQRLHVSGLELELLQGQMGGWDDERHLEVENGMKLEMNLFFLHFCWVSKYSFTWLF